MEIRFAGSTDSTQAAANDEWEIEVVGYGEEVDSPNIRYIKGTRGGKGIYGQHNKGAY